jgi:hypothetical protein
MQYGERWEKIDPTTTTTQQQQQQGYVDEKENMDPIFERKQA